MHVCWIKFLRKFIFSVNQRIISYISTKNKVYIYSEKNMRFCRFLLYFIIY